MRGHAITDLPLQHTETLTPEDTRRILRPEVFRIRVEDHLHNLLRGIDKWSSTVNILKLLVRDPTIEVLLHTIQFHLLIIEGPHLMEDRPLIIVDHPLIIVDHLLIIEDPPHTTADHLPTTVLHLPIIQFQVHITVDHLDTILFPLLITEVDQVLYTVVVPLLILVEVYLPEQYPLILLKIDMLDSN